MGAPGREAKAKPELDEIIGYAGRCIEVYINKCAQNLPEEQKDEMRQNAYLRICEAYTRLDAEKGWKAFVQQHCRGAVLDYIRHGQGFEESAQSLSKSEQEQEQAAERRFTDTLKIRVNPMNEDGDSFMSIEEIAGLFGVHADQEEERPRMHPNWRLLARMASADEKIHLVAKVLLGFKKPDLARQFGVSRERLCQRIKEFFETLDSPEKYHDHWTRQAIFAFGLWEFYGMEPEDIGMGWCYEPINLLDENSVSTALSDPQLAMDLGATRTDIA